MAGNTTTIDETITQIEVFELTYARIVVNHAENSITSFLHVVVRADTTKHRGFSQVRPSLVTQISENKIKFKMTEICGTGLFLPKYVCGHSILT